MDEIKKTPAEWCRENNVHMKDPDAWRNEGKSWTESITYAEFERLLSGPNTYFQGSQR